MFQSAATTSKPPNASGCICARKRRECTERSGSARAQIRRTAKTPIRSPSCVGLRDRNARSVSSDPSGWRPDHANRIDEGPSEHRRTSRARRAHRPRVAYGAGCASWRSHANNLLALSAWRGPPWLTNTLHWKRALIGLNVKWLSCFGSLSVGSRSA